MLTAHQISQLHRLHWVEKWSLRKIARHLHIGRRTMVWQTRITSGDALVALVTQTQMVLQRE